MTHFASLVRVLAGVISMRRTVALASIFLLGTGPAAPARVHTQAATGSATFIVTGHGWGHGVGMSQYGAYGYAQKGTGYEKIVLHYFPGTETRYGTACPHTSSADAVRPPELEKKYVLATCPW